MKNLLELMSKKNIQVFIGFANFYQYFIQSFSRIAILLILLLKIIWLLDLASKALRTDNNEVIRISDRTNKTIVNLSKNKKFRNFICVSNIRAIREPNFLIFNTKNVFNYLWLVFIKATIPQNFDLENYIQI